MSRLVTVRLDEPLVEVLEALVRCGLFKDRSQAIRALLYKAINSDSLIELLPPHLRRWLEVRFGGLP